MHVRTQAGSAATVATAADAVTTTRTGTCSGTCTNNRAATSAIWQSGAESAREAKL